MTLRVCHQPDRTAEPRRRLAIAISVAIFVATACSGQGATPGTAWVVTAGPSGAPTTAAGPSSSISPHAPPGGRLVYIALNEDGDGSLLTTNPDGTDTRPLLPAGNPPRWSPDGRRISVVAGNGDGLVFVGLVDPDGSQYVQFDSPDPTLNLGCFAWSPDGSRLACEGFDETDVTRNGIYTVRSSDGRDLVRVSTSPDGGHDIPTDYSPDGRQIVYVRQQLPDEADTTLMVVNVDGSGSRALSNRRLGGGRWSPGGQTILTDTGTSLLLVPLDGSEIKTIDIVSDSLRTAFFGSWSPDGQWIAFSGRASKSVDLYIVRADGTGLRQVTDTPMGQWEEAADWTAATP
jgi:Tol biopolymer transport system component